MRKNVMLIELNLREDILKHFPNFEYFNCTEPERLDFNLADNLVGDQQEAFLYYFILKQLKKYGGCGLDLGCGQNIHWACIGVNDYFGFEHPVYRGGPYIPHITSLVENIDEIFNPDTFSLIIASHILEHVNEPIFTFRKWCKFLKKEGIIILLLPDARYEKLKWDPTHINFFSPDDFERLIINSNKDILKTECFNDLANGFSFSFVGRRI